MRDSKVPPGQMPLLEIDQESLLDEARRELHILFPQRLQSLMGRAGVGMRAMAAITGISRSHLLRLKKGQCFPTIPTLLALARFFEVEPGYFFDPQTGDAIPDRRV